MAQEYESLAQAARRTGLSTRTLRRRIAAGLLPAFVAGRRTIRLRVEDVDLMMRPVLPGLGVDREVRSARLLAEC